MASNAYNPYNYQYQQSAAQSYSEYRTAPAPAPSNVPQTSRQDQPGTAQSTEYMSYQAQSYAGQSNAYGASSDNSWGVGSGYNFNRETAMGAAEVLHNMSNAGYTPTSTSPTQPSFTASNMATTRYPVTQQPQPPAQSAYGQQPAPQNVTSNSASGSSSNRGLPSPTTAVVYPSQRGAVYSQQAQRSGSPAHPSYAQGTQTPASTARSAALTSTSQYNDFNHRQLPNPTTVSTSYSGGDAQPTAPPAQAPSGTDTYNQGTITVDPMAVYNPWPEYQRKQEALRAQKAIEDAARAEDERIAEEKRQEEERKKEEELKRQEEEEKEEEERARQAQIAAGKQNARKQQQPNTAGTDAGSSTQEVHAGTEMEDEIRALMAKMREYNSKDPALLARIWEEERRVRAPKSPPVQNSTAAPPVSTAPPPAQPSAVPVAVPEKKAASKSATPKPTTPAVPKVKVSAVAAPAPAVSRSSGNTIWPPEKKAHLASAVATYLNTQNPERSIKATEVSRMLDGNPSYIELCEQLEMMGLKLDRAALAKHLLTAVPDVNSTSHAKTSQSLPANLTNSTNTQKAVVAPPAVMKRDIGTLATQGASYASAPTPLPARLAYIHNAPAPAPMAEMVPIKAGLKAPASKEEAARKRNFDDLVDLTQLPEDEDFEPPVKKANKGTMYSSATPGSILQDAVGLQSQKAANFPVTTTATPAVPESRLPPADDLRSTLIVKPLDRKKALRRNTYNIKTIARDVLLACGRHPEARQLNQHLEVLKSTLPQVTNDADLSTLRWDLIDPGKPPPGYFKRSVEMVVEDADDEQGLGTSTDHYKPRALPEATNPFKQKRRGRPPRHSMPSDLNSPSTPPRTTAINMSTSAPRPAAPATGVGYAAFRSATAYDANGNPLPKKKGRPVGWRKHIHGSAAAQANSNSKGHSKPPSSVLGNPSTLGQVKDSEKEPIHIDSDSPSIQSQAHRYHSYKCQWKHCSAELHNLETLKKHVCKVHRKESPDGSLKCHWADCGTEVASHDLMSNMRIERYNPKSFSDAQHWQDHLEEAHFSPLSWRYGDGPAGGVSDATDSEAYLSDAHGRRVTPRIFARPEYLDSDSFDDRAEFGHSQAAFAPRGRSRPPKATVEQEARDEVKRYVNQKRRIGPGMDRGGATLVNEKRRKGFSDNDEVEEELVDAED